MPIVVGLGSNSDFEWKDPLGLYSKTPGLGQKAETAKPVETGTASKTGASSPQQTTPSIEPVTQPEKLPAGMRNNNPGNIKYRADVPWEGLVGPSENLDQGDPQAVFDSAEKGMRAAAKLARNKYAKGMKTPLDIIASEEGWTPGNTQAAENIAKTMGVSPDEDLRLDDPARLQTFMRALVRQEHGPASDAYSDQMIGSTISALLAEPPSESAKAPAVRALDDLAAGGKANDNSDRIAGNPDAKGFARLVPPDPEAPKGSGGRLSFVHEGQDRLRPELQSALVDVSAVLGRDLTIQSGYRPANHPVEARKRQPGQHSHGNAADINMRGMTEAQRVQLITELQARGVKRFGLYSNMPDVLHVDLKDQTGAGSSWFMYDTTNRKLQNAPQWFKDLAASKQGAQRPAKSGGTIVLDPSFTPRDPMGLYKGGESPFKVDVPIPTPAPREEQSQVQQASAVDQIWQQMEAKEPGRYQVIDEAEYENWREQWASGQSNQFMKGLKGALIDQNPELLGNAMDALGVLGETQTLRELGGSLQEWGKQGSWSRQPRVGSITGIRTDSIGNFIDDATDYAAYSLGAGLGSMAPGIAAGAAGTAASGGNPVVGFIAGASGPAYIQNLGDVYGALRDNPNIQARVAKGELTERQVAGWAAAAAAPMAAIDAVGLGKVVGAMGGGAVKRSIARRIVNGLATGALTEGGTEALQQVISESVQEALGADKSTSDQVVAVIDSAIGGALAGGAVGGPAGALQRPGNQAQPAAQAPDAATAAPQPKSGPLTRAIEHAERKVVESAEPIFRIEDPAFGDMPAGEMHGQQVRLSPDQAGVPEGMRRVVLPDGQQTLMGDKLLVQEAAPAAPALAPAAPAAGQSAAASPQGAPAIGATVRVDAEGMQPFMATIEGYEGDEAIIFDRSTGESLQVPIAQLTEIAKPVEPLAPAKPAQQPAGTDVPTVITKGMRDRLGDLGYDNSAIRKMDPQTAHNIIRAADNPVPVDPNDAALKPQEPVVDEAKTELPPQDEQRPALERFPRPPEPGKRVIVDAPGVGRFAAKVERYITDGDTTEAVVVDDNGTPMQVPVDQLYISKLTPKEAEAEELRRNPPVERDDAVAGQPLARKLGDKAVMLPDEKHARLYDLGKERRLTQSVMRASKLDLGSVMPDEHRRLADEFGVTPEALGQMADDYRYRVERAGKDARSKLPVKMHAVDPKRLKAWQSERARAETEAPESVPEYASKNAVAAAVIDEAAHQAATSPQNGRPEPTEAQKEAGNYAKGHVRLGGLDLSIENPAGSERKGVSRSGKPWSIRMKSHYGYIRGTVGRDKDHIDIFVKPGTAELANDEPVFVVDQRDPARGRFDEHKVMAGWGTAEEARKAYLENYTKNWQGLGAITESTLGDFKAWLMTGDTRQPFGKRTASESDSTQKPAKQAKAAVPDRQRDSAPPKREKRPAKQDPVPPVDKRAEKSAPVAENVAQPVAFTPEQDAVISALATLFAGGNADRTRERIVEEAQLFGPERLAFSVRRPAGGGRIETLWFDITGNVFSTKLNGSPEQVRRGDYRDTLSGFVNVDHGFDPKRFIEQAAQRAATPAKPVPAAPPRSIEKASGPSIAEKIDELFASNKLFTAEKVEAARARLKSKMGQINSGIDPELLIDGMTIAGAYIEAGVRSFGDYAKRMVGDFGPSIRPYLLSFWEGARNYPGLDTEGMTSPEESARLHAELNGELPASEAPALGSEVKAPKRTKKTGRPEDRTLVQDWGVEHIDGYGTDPDREIGNDTKDAFLKDAAQFLKAVSKMLIDQGFTVPTDRKGKPMKPVHTNESGPAGAGEVSLTLINPDTGANVYAHVGDTALRGVVPTTPSGIALMFRASKVEGDTYGARGVNRWAPVGLTAGELAAMIAKEAGGGLAPADIARPAVEKADEPAELGRDGPRALEGASTEPVQGAVRGRDAGSQPARSSQTDLFGGQPARGRRVSAGRGVADGEGEPSAAASGGQPAAADAVADAPNDEGGAERPEVDSPRVDASQSAATPAADRPVDYTISEADEIGAGGAKTKFRNNVAAIRLLRELDAEKRPATRDEQSVLAKWVGWGGLGAAFPREDGSVAKGWEKEAAELRELLTEEEYRAAASSTRNAHYTSAEVVTAIWQAVERLGFKGGQVLEPSVGAGNFLGLMPGQFKAGSRVTGVELDHITGGIAKNLYPHANIQAPLGFQALTVPDGWFDLAIGNPPFGSERLYDADRRHLNKFSIHNFFFAKSIEALRPGGVLAMVVTNYFLDASSSTAREFIADRANLLGAIRLPNNAFLKNAGTEVTTDIIILQKRAEGDSEGDRSWAFVGEWRDKEGRTVPLNRYFIDNPSMMLGEFGAYGTMYRGDEAALVSRPDDDLPKLLEQAIARLPRAVMPEPGTIIEAETVTVPNTVEDAVVGSMFLDGNSDVHIRTPDHLGAPQSSRVEFPNEKAKERVAGMIRIRDAFAKLRRAQIDESATDDKIEKLRGDLNKFYDAFAKKHGPINADANKRLFRDDPTWPQIAALEEGFDKGISATVAQRTGEAPRVPSAKKAPIFFKRTQQPYRRPTTASSAKDALATVLADRGRVDLAEMSRLYGKSEEEIVRELGPLLYKTPSGAWETADHYLSGNVKAKLAEAERAAESDPEFRRNIAALRDVIPADIEAVDIDVKPGAPWVPRNHVADFLDHITEGKGSRVTYSPMNAKWMIDPARASAAADSQWSTDRASVSRVLDAVLNGQSITIYDKDGDKQVLNQAATDAANEKAERIKTEWRRWIWEDDARREQLVRLYNDTFNTDVIRSFDGSHLSLPGKVGDDIISLRPHQKNFVWRVLQSSTTLADHVVGAGKTFAVIASVMEMRRIGQARKPMVVVPNHLVGQWAADFIKLYPGAKILAATKKDFEAENRKKLFARVATGDWDAVIVAHSSFGRIPVSPEFEKRFIEKQIDQIEESERALRAESDKDARNVKQLAKWRENMEAKLKRLLDAGAKDVGMTFEEMGVDAIVVDEAHEFKNLAFPTSMTRVAGLGNPAGSQKAADLYMKIQSVQERTGGRNIVFATGTPLSNTMAEMFTVQRYLDGATIEAMGVAHFDAWAKVFGEVVTDWELSPSGQYKLNSRFARFVNMPELMQRYLSFADVITNDDIKAQLAAIGKKLPLPRVKSGKPENVVVERSPDQATYIGVGTQDEQGNMQFPKGSLVWRAENLPKKAEKGADNMLKVMSDARKAALDMRLINPSYPDHPGSKVHIAADRMKAIYDRWSHKRGIQLVFIDLSTPKKARAKEEARIRELMRLAEQGDEAAQQALDNMSPDEFMALDGDFSVYDDLKQKLIDRGVPEAEIAFIHDANTEQQKEELFGKVRSGRVRFLFGSTPKMGAGTNVQNRLVALHHLDAPWRPSDLEQRDGRGIRQGNELYAEDPEGFEIEILRYATKNTLDARQWQTIEGKARFIQQMRKGDVKSRIIEDIAGEAANAAEMKAAASGNPLILEEMDLRHKVRKLEGQASEHDREQHRIRGRIRTMQGEIVDIDKRRDAVEADADSAAQLIETGITATVRGEALEKPKEIGAAVLAAARAMLIDGTQREKLGKIGAFGLTLEHAYGTSFRVLIEGSEEHSVHLDDTGTADETGVGMRINNTIRNLPRQPQAIAERRAELERQIPALEKQIAPFAGAADLEDATARHREVLAKLQQKAKPAGQPVADTTEAGDQREYSIAEETPPRRFGFPKQFKTVTRFTDDKDLTSHPDYRAAKAGDVAAAARLVPSVVDEAMLERVRNAYGSDVIYVAPHAEEASGRNVIPHALAHYLSASTGGAVDEGIVQTSHAFHTGARPLDRLLGRPTFGGAVQRGGKYVLVDDVTVLGGTLAELANHIQSAGGQVVGAVTLVNRSRSGIRAAPKQHVRLVEARYGDIIRQEFGIEPAALTGDEALVIAGYRDADALRSGVAAAAQGRERRLLQKGVRPAEGREGQVSPDDAEPDEFGAFEPASLSEAEQQEIRDIVREVAGLDDVTFQERINLPRGAPGWGSDAPTTAAGFYDPALDAITISLESGVSRTAYHEAFHRLQRLFLTDAERAVLRQEGGRLRSIVASAMGREAQSGRMSQKELEAEAFAIYADRAARGERSSVQPHKSYRGAWDRISTMIRRVRNWLAGHGYQTSEDVFDRARQGETRRRGQQATARSEGREYSLTPAEVLREVKAKGTDWTPALLGAIPLNYFVELARPGMTAVADYLKVKRQMDAYRGKKHAAMDEIAQEWRKFARLGWGPLGKEGKARAAELAELMHESTLAGVDPSKTDKESQAHPDYPALRQRYMALPPAGRELYAKVRDAYKQQAAEVDQILLDNVRKAQTIAQNRAEADFKRELERLKKAKMSEFDRKAAIEEVERNHVAARTRAQWSMKARLTRLRIAFEASRVQEPYFPLARFGRYYVAVRDVDGSIMSFSKRERAADRDRLADEMRKAFPGATVEVGVMDEGASAREAMDPRLVAEIETIVGGAGFDPESTATMLDQIWQRYLQTLPDLSTRKRFIHRKGTAGFDADALRAFAHHMFHAAHQMGRLKYGMELQELTNEVADQAKRSDDPTRGVTLSNELKKRHQWVMNPMGAKWSQAINSTAFIYYLAATPAAAIVNTLQTPMMGIPILGARFGGTAKAAAALAKASADSVAGKGSVTNANLTDDEKRALAAFYESGLIDRTQSHDLAGVGETGVQYSPVRARVMAVISWLYHRAEVWNREVTALAAYRMARSAGQNVTQAIDTAHDLTWKTHFDYSNASRLRYLQSDAAKAVFVFQSHQINMLYRLLRDAHQAFRGETPAARKEAFYQLAGVLGMMSFAAGIRGAFGYAVMMTLLGMFLGDDDDPLGLDQQFQKAVIDTLGPTAGGMLLNGVPGHLLGIDLTGRIGMPYVWIRPEERELEGRDAFESLVMRMLGANVGMVGNWWYGATLMADGNVGRGIETAAPKFIKDALKTYRYLSEGVTNLRGDEILPRDQLDGWDFIAQVAGFTPAKVAETYERNGALMNAEARVKKRRQELVNRYALAHRMGDDETRREVLADIKRFNAVDLHKAIAIKPETLQRSIQVRERNAKKRVDGVLIENQRLGRDLREMLAEPIYR